MNSTNLAYKALWFDSCAADVGMTLLILSAFVAALFGIAYLIALTPSSSIARGRAQGLMWLCALELVMAGRSSRWNPFLRNSFG